MKRWHKILLSLLGATTVVFGGPGAVIKTEVALLPANEKFVVASDDVVLVRDLAPVASSSKETIVEYSYKQKVSAPLQGEVVELRTPMSTTRQIGANKYVATFTGEQKFYQENGVWYDLATATTTRSAYDLQKASLFPLVGATTDAQTSSGTWTVPVGVCQVVAKVWGAGGGGGGAGVSGDGGGGGGGGGYSEATLSVTAGNVHNLTVGIGGLNGITGVRGGAAGGDSMFMSSSTVLAKGGGAGSAGQGGGDAAGGAAASGVGDVKHSGGAGKNGPGGANHGGSGGGGSGGNTTDGGDGGIGGAGTGGTAGTAGTTNGAAGGAGGNTSNAGSAGSAPGGGSGGGGQGANGASGLRGEVDLVYTVGVGCASASTQVRIQNGKINHQNGKSIIKN